MSGMVDSKKASVGTVARIVGLLAGGMLLSSCSEGVLDPRGPVGQAERVILYDATIMLAVVIPVIILTLAFAWWFRSGNARATYRSTLEYAGRMNLGSRARLGT
jgi:cytochrome o ubiquinol oxidase subunit 2